MFWLSATELFEKLKSFEVYKRFASSLNDTFFIVFDNIFIDSWFFFNGFGIKLKFPSRTTIDSGYWLFESSWLFSDSIVLRSLYRYSLFMPWKYSCGEKPLNICLYNTWYLLKGKICSLFICPNEDYFAPSFYKEL